MNDWLQHLVAKYRSRGILVDANVLLLYFIGGFRIDLVPRFKRTKQFVAEDYRRLSYVLAEFMLIVTTPHVLCEVSNLSASLSEPMKGEYFAHFARGIRLLDEQHLPSTEVIGHSGFTRFGLTDTVIASIAADRYLVLTDDLDLSRFLDSLGVDAINFNHIRSLARP